MTLRRLAAGLAITIIATTLIASPVRAHAELLASSPAPNSVLEQSPDAIVLTFSEAVDVVDDSLRLVDASGAAVAVGEVRRDGGDDTVAVDVTEDLVGSYVVAWQVVSADAHPISGAYTFSVGEVTSTDPDVTPALIGVGTGAFGWTADGFRTLRSRRGGLVRLRGGASGGYTVTAGSWSDMTATTPCASADGIMTTSDAAAENILRTTLCNAMPPHDNCYSRHATVST